MEKDGVLTSSLFNAFTIAFRFDPPMLHHNESETSEGCLVFVNVRRYCQDADGDAVHQQAYEDLPGNIQIYESVNQMAVLYVADAFVTHCGMNSASEGLYFQMPLILFPQTPEQDAVAKRVEELGAGVRLKSISEEDIIQALRQIIEEPGYREKAIEISNSFRSCGGASEAKSFLEEVAQL